MKKLGIGFISFFILMVSSSFVLASADAIIKPYQKQGISITVHAVDLQTGKSLMSVASQKPMNPASTMKVLTSVAALKHLGGSYQYQTELGTDRYSRGVIGHLYVKGAGDPSMVEERLWRIAKDLAVRGVKKIEGDIIIDESYFDGKDFKGRDEDSSRAYNAEISAFAVNFNSFAVVAKNYGGELAVHIDPPTDYFEFKSLVKASGNSLSVERDFKNGKEHVVARGGVSNEKIKYANADNPLQYSGTTLAWVIRQQGIEFNGKIKRGTYAAKKRLVKDKSKPLSLILRDLNKFSNNFTAEMIVKTIGAFHGGVPGSTEKGAVALRRLVESYGVAQGEYAVFNGSGLSRRNRLSAHTLTTLLDKAYDDNSIRSDFMASLAIAGTDGTLGNRFKNPALKGNVKAKTGTLHDVSTLAGYIKSKSGKMIAFAILVNGPGAGGGGYYQMQEKIMLELYRQ